MLKLNLKEQKTYTIKHKGLEVEIQPLPKKEDNALEKQFTTGRMSIVKGVRRKRRDNEEINLPETDHFGFNLARAKKTWESWNLADEKGKALDCNNENITFLFNNHYDEYARHILEKLAEILNDDYREESDDQEEAEKN